MPETVYSVLKPSSLEYQCYRGIQIIQTHQTVTDWHIYHSLTLRFSLHLKTNARTL